MYIFDHICRNLAFSSALQQCLRMSPGLPNASTPIAGGAKNVDPINRHSDPPNEQFGNWKMAHEIEHI